MSPPVHGRSERTARSHAASLVVSLAIVAACGTQRSAAPLPYPAELGQGAANTGSLLYLRQLTPIERSPLWSDERGSVAIDRERGWIYSGSRTGELLALERSSGRAAWERDLTGAISSTPLLADPSTLLVGTDDGALLAVDPQNGEVGWRYETVGTIRNAPVVHDGVVYFVNSRDQVFALDVRTGAWRWQYERDLPPGFTLHGRAGLTFVPAGQLARYDLADEIGVVLTGFADGRVVALSASSGEALWLTDLAPAGVSEFVDADTTPIVDASRREVVVAGQTSGVQALALSDGSLRWTVSLRGTGAITRLDEQTYVAASSLDGLVAFESGGRIRWRRQLDPGVVGAAVAVGERIYVPHSEAGLLVFGSARGELLAAIDVGSGISGGVVVDRDAGQLFVVTNRGALLAFQLTAEAS